MASGIFVMTPEGLRPGIVTRGKSAYEVAKDNGFIGTESQWLASLRPSKTDLGLGNVDNTSDLNKPISTATQLALDEIGKIWVTSPTSSPGWNADPLIITREGRKLIYDGRIMTAVNSPDVTLTTSLLTVAVAPVGFRPARNMRFQLKGSGSTTAFEVILYADTGNISFRALSGVGATTTTISSTSYFNFDGACVVAQGILPS